MAIASRQGRLMGLARTVQWWRHPDALMSLCYVNRGGDGSGCAALADASGLHGHEVQGGHCLGTMSRMIILRLPSRGSADASRLGSHASRQLTPEVRLAILQT